MRLACSMQRIVNAKRICVGGGRDLVILNVEITGRDSVHTWFCKHVIWSQLMFSLVGMLWKLQDMKVYIFAM